MQKLMSPGLLMKSRGICIHGPVLLHLPAMSFTYFSGSTIPSMPPILVVAVLLTISNLFMTYAWYGHLKDHAHQPLWIAVLVSWGVAFFEYLVQVPANRFGNYHHISLGQLKILQEVITLAVFVPFAIYYMNRPLSWNFLWAGCCMLGAVYFIFNDPAAKAEKHESTATAQAANEQVTHQEVSSPLPAVTHTSRED